MLKVRVEIDKLGDLKLKISDLFGGRKVIGNDWHTKCSTNLFSFFEINDFCQLDKILAVFDFRKQNRFLTNIFCLLLIILNICKIF